MSESDQMLSVNFNNIFLNAQVSALKAALSEEQKVIFNESLLAQKAYLQKQWEQTNVKEIPKWLSLFDQALL